MRVSRTRLAALVSLAFGACFAPTTVAADGARWTLVLYLCGDGPREGTATLEAETMAAVQALVAAPADSRVNVLALVDRRGTSPETLPIHRAGQPATRCQDERWSGARLLHLAGRCADELEAPHEAAMGRQDTLDHVLAIAATRFPAEHFALVVKGHALPAGSIAMDAVRSGGPSGPAAPDDGLDVAELARALATFTGAIHEKLQFLVLDGCSMGTVETLAPLAPHVEQFVASPDLLFARSLPYGALLRALQRDTGADPTDPARALVDAYPDGAPPDEKFGLLACIRAERVQRLAAALNDLGAAILPTGAPLADDGARWLGSAAVRAQSFPVREFKDARAVADALLEAGPPTADLRTKAEGLLAAAADVAERRSSGPEFDDACGLSLCLPRMAPAGYLDADRPWHDDAWTRVVRAFEGRMGSLSSASVKAFPTQVDAVRVGGVAGIRVSSTLAIPRPVLADVPVLAEFDVRVGDAADPVVLRLPTLVPPPNSPIDQAPGTLLRDLWTFERFLLLGGATRGAGAAGIECPIERIERLRAKSGQRRIVATTGCVTVVPANASPYDATLRLHAVETVDVDGRATWKAEVLCAFVVPQAAGSCDGPRPSPPTAAFHVPLGVGTVLRTRVRPEPDPTRPDLAREKPVVTRPPEIRIESLRPDALVAYRAFPPGTRLTVGHSVVYPLAGTRSSGPFDTAVPGPTWFEPDWVHRGRNER